MDARFTSTIDSSELFQDNYLYRSFVGALLYVVVCARTDIAVSASILGRKVCEPTSIDWTAAKRVLRFLKATKDVRLVFGDSTEGLVGNSDADWTGDLATRRSTSGYVFKYAEEQGHGQAECNIV